MDLSEGRWRKEQNHGTRNAIAVAGLVVKAIAMAASSMTVTMSSILLNRYKLGG